MTRLAALFILWLCLPTYLRAQCLPANRAAQVRSEAIRLLSGADSASASERYVWDLPKMPRTHIIVLQDPVLCRQVRALYAKYETPEDSAGAPVDSFAVVRADSLLFIESGETAGRRGPSWLVLVVDLTGSKRYGYAEGL